MRIYDSAFYGILFFLIGVFLSGFGLNFYAIVLTAVLMAVLFLFFGFFKKNLEKGKIKKLFWLSGLSLFLAIGAFYYFIFQSYQFQNSEIFYNKNIIFEGIILDNVIQAKSQRLTVELQSPQKGKISVQAREFPIFDYGDKIEFKGIIKILPAGSEAAYLKNGVLGISQYPKTNFVSSGNGNQIKSSLLFFKGKVVGIFGKIFPSEQAAFLSGITLGERAEFSKEFKELMSKSGTTHLIALSGYNISILVLVVFGALGYLFSRRICFWLTLLVIIGFVLMTGAQASVVRAAIMGGIILLASQVNRLYSFRNIIAVAALLMVLANPMVLIFDVGFQLSFMALLGIVYFSPALKKVFNISDDSGFLSIKENFLATFSAQIFVAPFLIAYFGNFSLLSLIANILILSAIPLTMALGFIAAAIGLMSLNLAIIFGWLVNILATYEISIIKIFGKLDLLQVTSISVSLIIIYYVILTGFIAYPEHLSAIANNSGKSIYKYLKNKINSLRYS